MADAFRQGSHAADSVTALKSFWAYATADKIATIRLAATSSGYQVTAGKTLYITRITIASNSGNTTVSTSIGYGTSDVGFDSAADPTGYVAAIGNNHIGATTVNQTPFVHASTTGTVGNSTFNVLIPIPAAKYPTAFIGAAATAVYLEGYEA